MVRSLAFLMACGWAMACAPSHRMVHDGNVYFEHCYGAEFDHQVSPAEREACWSAWLVHYTRHQPAHRIDYALRRVEAIQAGDQTLLLPGMAGGMTPPPTDPTASHLSRAFDRRVGEGVATTSPAKAADAVPPEHGCESGCATLQAKCSAACPPDAPSCHVLCKRDGAICKRGCY